MTLLEKLIHRMLHDAHAGIFDQMTLIKDIDGINERWHELHAAMMHVSSAITEIESTQEEEKAS